MTRTVLKAQDKRVMSKKSLAQILNLLQREGFQTVGPTVGDKAVILGELRSVTDTVILIDAVSSGSGTSAGKIYRFSDSDQPVPDCVLSPSTHRLGLARTMALARALDRLLRCLILYGIEGICFDFGCELTPMVKKAAARVMRMIIEDVFRFSTGASPTGVI